MEKIKNFYRLLMNLFRTKSLEHKKILDYINKNPSLEHKKILDYINKNPSRDFYSDWGYAKSTKNLSLTDKMRIFLHFQYSEKAKVALSVASSYPGGHYLEFGSHDLYTLRNFLAAFDVGNLNSRYPNTKFYAFDIFGSYSEEVFFKKVNQHENPKSYFDDFTHHGDLIPAYKKLLKEFNVFSDRTFLIKGFFEDTVKDFELDDKIGFVFLDCNIVNSYKFVLDWLENKVSNGMYMYFDEYFDRADVNHAIENFREKLLDKYKIKLHYVRSAASVGALFRCYNI